MKKFALSLAVLAPLSASAFAGGEQCRALSDADKTEIRTVFAQVMGEVSCTDACADACTEECMDAALVKMKGYENSGYGKKKWAEASQASYGAKQVAASEKEKKAAYWGKPQASLASKMAENPEAQAFISHLVTEAFLASETSVPQRGALVKMLAAEKSEACAELAGHLYEKAPQHFRTTDMLVMTEYGHEDFWKPLKKLAMASCDSEAADIRPAALLAFEGVDVGAKALKRAAQVDVAPDTVCSAMVAAAALEKLGYEGVSTDTRLRVRTAVLSALDEGRVETARDIALRAEFLAEQLDKKEWISLSGIDSGAAWHCATKREKLAQADEIFELIERISPM